MFTTYTVAGMNYCKSPMPENKGCTAEDEWSRQSPAELSLALYASFGNWVFLALSALVTVGVAQELVLAVEAQSLHLAIDLFLVCPEYFLLLHKSVSSGLAHTWPF